MIFSPSRQPAPKRPSDPDFRIWALQWGSQPISFHPHKAEADRACAVLASQEEEIERLKAGSESLPGDTLEVRPWLARKVTDLLTKLAKEGSV